MRNKEEVLKYGLSFPDTYQNAPFHDDNWQLIPDDEVKRMIADSYDLVTDTPTKRIYEAVRRIPKGKVATYGTVATMAGNPRMSRAVGNALHKNPDPEHIPCHRVVNAKGELADAFVFGGPGVQQSRLEAEGIEVKDGRVDLKKYGYTDTITQT